jgi:hypothetical protein
MMKLNEALGRFSIQDLDKLNHASELLAATAAGLDQLSTPARGPLRQLVYEANQEILAVMAKPARNFALWHQRKTEGRIEAGDAGTSTETV